jgi:RAB protein geranylgeranyltransferase component A
MIDKLVEMDVGRYVEFKMLDGVLVAQPPPPPPPPAVTSSSAGEQGDGDGDDGQTAIQFTAVPSSKEAIFKDKSISLVEKRKLMKVLMVAVGGDVGSAEGVKGEKVYHISRLGDNSG